MSSTQTQNPEAQVEPNIIDEIIRASDFSYENLPMLKIIGERLAATLATEMMDLTMGACDISLVQLDYVQAAQAMSALPEPSLFAIALAHELDGEILLATNSTLLLTAVELILGGNAKGPLNNDKMELTVIERSFGRQISDLIFSEFQNSFALADKVKFQLDRMETDADSASVAQPASLCVRLRFSCMLAGRSGEFTLVLPYDLMEPVRHKLNRIHFSDVADDYNPWRNQIEGQIKQSAVQLETVLAEISVPIGDMLAWSPGKTLNLWIDDSHETKVVCNDETMFAAEMGKSKNGNIAIKISHCLNETQETENDSKSD